MVLAITPRTRLESPNVACSLLAVMAFVSMFQLGWAVPAGQRMGAV